MCLALPARLVQLKRAPSPALPAVPRGDMSSPAEPDLLMSADLAIVDLGGVRKEICIALVPQAREGDYVIVHVGHAIGMIDPEEAERTLALFGELAAWQETTIEVH